MYVQGFRVQSASHVLRLHFAITVVPVDIERGEGGAARVRGEKKVARPVLEADFSVYAPCPAQFSLAAPIVRPATHLTPAAGDLPPRFTKGTTESTPVGQGLVLGSWCVISRQRYC